MVYDTFVRENKRKGFNMKKFVLLSFVAALFSNVAIADVYVENVNDCDEMEMRAALDDATVEQRAVITIVECDNDVDVETTTVVAPRYTRNWDDSYVNRYIRHTCENQPKPVRAVVSREYFVRETVQEYKPVIKYVPSHTYVRVRPACNECGL